MNPCSVSGWLHQSARSGSGFKDSRWISRRAIAGCTFFIAREHTQAEYRWIEMFGHGKRMNMPWWGGFDPRAWDVASLMDFAVPVVACLLVWLLVNRG